MNNAILKEEIIQANSANEQFLHKFFTETKQVFGEEIFAKWFAKLEIFSYNGAELILKAPSKFMRDWIIREFVENKKAKTTLTKIACQIDKNIKKLSVISISEEIVATFKTSETKIVNLSKHDNIFAFGTELNPKYTFKNFVSAKYNKLAVTMAKIAAGVEQDQLNLFDEKIPLYIHGGVGMGKTHLAQAIAWKIKEEDKSKKVVYLSAEKFMYHFVQSVRSNDMMNFKAQFRSVDVLIIDDVQFIAGKQSTQEEFMHSFNHLVENNKQVILVCDRCPSDLESIDEKLKSRISGGMILNFKKADFADRFEILKAKSALNGEEIDEKILELIAAKINSSIRDLDGAIRKLITAKIFGQEEITLETAKSVIAEYININKSSEISINKIKKIVATHFDIKINALSEANRQQAIAKARQIAMFLSKTMTTQSLPNIGREFAKNHATVIYAVKSVQKMVEKDAILAKEIKLLEEKILN